ncbi:hypothetical protein [Alloyangia pacifica]|uniref:hypothetical protein n=1 Tax=Alloyangia pacifica TaxID=311180 RepID=UPI000B8399F8|nr:hypothetical protein [Alloyangia pacifica]
MLPRLPGLSRRRLPAPLSASDAGLPGACTSAGIEIPIREVPPEQAACARLVDLGRSLARQDRWAALGDALGEADGSRQLTPAGTPVARLICDGALEDVTARAAASVAQGDLEGTLATMRGFIAALGATTEDPFKALLAARAHLAAARLWRRAGPCGLTEVQRAAAARDHMDAAHLLLRPHPPSQHGSAALAAARCAVIEVLPDPVSRLATEFEALIAAEPACPEHLRAYGRALCPARFGTWPGLERAARRLAMLTRATWGGGAYTWIWLDVLASQPEGFGHLDAELFTAGLHDILDGGPGHPVDPQRHQHLANFFAAWSAARPTVVSRAGAGTGAGSGADEACAQVTSCLGWVVTDHLRELHPALWGGGQPDAPSPAAPTCVPTGPDQDAAKKAGTATARAVLEKVFADQLARGRSVIFTEDGIALRPAGSASCTLAPCAALAYPRRNLRDEDPPCLT